MLNNSTQTFHIQKLSYEKYLKDMWIVSLFFVLLLNETLVSLPFLWIGIQIFTVLVAQYTFSKFGPSLIIAFIIPTVSLLFLFLFGGPFWLYCIGVLISVCCLHYRYNVIQLDEDSDNPFALLSLMVFFSIHLICIMLVIENYKITLYSVFIGGVIFFVGLRLFSVWRKSYSHTKESLNQFALYYLVGLSVIFLLTFLSFLIFSPVRQLLGVILQGLFTIVMLPLTPLLLLIEKYLSNLFSEPAEEREQDIVANDGIMDGLRQDESEAITSSFPIEWILFGALGIVILLIVTYIIKKKIEFPVEQQRNNFIYKNDNLAIQDEELLKQSTIYKVEASFLRELYLEFEKEATSLGYNREMSETVREWFKRMSWEVKGEFFSTYEEVRYGGHMVGEEQADIFIEELDKIKKILKKEV